MLELKKFMNEAVKASVVAEYVRSKYFSARLYMIVGRLNVKTECDFAYRVREFVYSERRGARDKGNVSEGAIFGRGKGAGKTQAGGDDDEDDDDDEMVLEFVEFEDEEIEWGS